MNPLDVGTVHPRLPNLVNSTNFRNLEIIIGFQLREFQGIAQDIPGRSPGYTAGLQGDNHDFGMTRKPDHVDVGFSGNKPCNHAVSVKVLDPFQVTIGHQLEKLFRVDRVACASAVSDCRFLGVPDTAVMGTEENGSAFSLDLKGMRLILSFLAPASRPARVHNAHVAVSRSFLKLAARF